MVLLQYTKHQFVLFSMSLFPSFTIDAGCRTAALIYFKNGYLFAAVLVA